MRTSSQEIVRQPGMLAFLEHLRRQGMSALKGYASGGLVTGINPGTLRSTGAESTRAPIILQWPDGTRSPMSASSDVADEVLRVFRSAALQRGRRK